MVSGSRKRRRQDGRLASPPLAPSPLLTRNLQLLPVGLTQLPKDELFVTRLRHDVDDLLSAFSEAFILTALRGTEPEQIEQVALSSQNTIQEREHVPSPFSVFAQLWQQKGWNLIQFTFADHTDSKCAFGDAICRVLMEHQSAYVADRNHHLSQDPVLPHSIRLVDLKELFKIMAVPFALYTFWCTQIYPTSGIGVKHCRPAMERIHIEQDHYDWLLELPEAVLKHLQDEPRTKSSAEAITADLVEVVCRLVGPPLDESRGDRNAAETLTRAQSSRPKLYGRAKPRQAWQDDPDAGGLNANSGLEPVFDIIPASGLATRQPRTWPSVRVMSSLEANKEFGRVGNIVRISSREMGHEALLQPQLSTEPTSGGSEVADSREVRETVAGLSRGDVVRLKARQRLAMASIDLSKLLGEHDNGEDTDSDAARQRVPPSDLLAQTARQGPQSSSSTRTRYEIETPTWITSAKYTARMKEWLEESSTPMQQSLQRASDSKKRYLESRAKIMPCATALSSTDADGGDPSAIETDFGDWVLQSFRRERKALRGKNADTSLQTESTAAEVANGPSLDLPSVDEDGTLSLESLYQLAAHRTKTAALQRGEMLKSARARSSRSK